jgi:hypothetical protein
MPMTARTRFPREVLEALRAGKILGIRAGAGPHRVIGLRMVAAEGRLFVRSWSRPQPERERGPPARAEIELTAHVRRGRPLGPRADDAGQSELHARRAERCPVVPLWPGRQA